MKALLAAWNTQDLPRNTSQRNPSSVQVSRAILMPTRRNYSHRLPRQRPLKREHKGAGVKASPLVRRLATPSKASGFGNMVRGSGPNGRIVKRDLLPQRAANWLSELYQEGLRGLSRSLPCGKSYRARDRSKRNPAFLPRSISVQPQCLLLKASTQCGARIRKDRKLSPNDI
ncbi:MAG: hypothetical protein H6715_01900 [Myxococcales bacterium]|nr:hypothetical protein [Myxococcales bacterium]